METRVLPCSTEIARAKNADEGHCAGGQVQEQRGVLVEPKRGEEDGRERGGHGRSSAAEERENHDSPELILEESLADLIELDVLVLQPGIVDAHTLDQQLLLLVAEALGPLRRVREDPKQRDAPNKGHGTGEQVHDLPRVQMAVSNVGQSVVNEG